MSRTRVTSNLWLPVRPPERHKYGYHPVRSVYELTAFLWESRQGAAFCTLVAEIDGCPSLGELARLGKRLYALSLPHDQAGVAWSRYGFRRAALEAGGGAGAWRGA